MNQPGETISFEQALERLEAVVRDLEGTEIGLDRSLTRYQEGVQLLKRCRAILDDAERKVRLLAGVDSDGVPVTQDWDATPTAERDARVSREPAAKPVRSTGRTPRRTVQEPLEEEDQLF
jgi:exodeoxyribonuclease VII small subunit